MKAHNIFSMASSMSSMQRYSQTFMNKKESVLEHTGFVVLFCCFVGQELISRGKQIDIALLLSKAACHDIDEIITGDIPRPTKYFDEEARKTFERIENHGINKLVDSMSLPPSVFRFWKESKSGDTGTIVAIADVAAVAYKFWEETCVLGNKGFVGHGENVREHLNKILIGLEDEYLIEVVKDLLELIRGEQ